MARMILRQPSEQKVADGRTALKFMIVRKGCIHVIGINRFGAFVKDSAECGSPKERIFVWEGEPGNGKTFFLEYDRS